MDSLWYTTSDSQKTFRACLKCSCNMCFHEQITFNTRGTSFWCFTSQFSQLLAFGRAFSTSHRVKSCLGKTELLVRKKKTSYQRSFLFEEKTQICGNARCVVARNNIVPIKLKMHMHQTSSIITEVDL